jgi:putative addiction module killer protein
MYRLLQSNFFESWLLGLRDRGTRDIVIGRLRRLERGLLGDTKSVGDGVHEMRIHVGPGYRIYFQIRGTEIILLLCAGDKGSQSRDFERAGAIAQAWKMT